MPVQMTRLQELVRRCEDIGLAVCTHSPGDGGTRYRFFDAYAITPRQTFFGPASGLKTVLGYARAVAFLDAVALGVYLQRERM